MWSAKAFKLQKALIIGVKLVGMGLLVRIGLNRWLATIIWVMRLAIAITKVSSKGQLVIPQEMREEIKLKKGEKLLAYSTKDMIVLKKIESSLKEFEKLAAWGRQFARKKGIKPKDVLKDD